jgi:HSP20 family protein
MSKTLFGPLSEFQRVMDLMDRSMGQLWMEGIARSDDKASAYTLPIDVWQKGTSLFIRAAVPGVKPEDLNIQFHNGTLTLSGETKRVAELDEDARVWRSEYVHGQFSRSVRLPENVIDENIEATFDNGFVTVAIPLLQQEKTAKKIPVKSIVMGDHPALEQVATSESS